MVSLCLTKTQIDSRATEPNSYAEGRKKLNKNRKNNKNHTLNAKNASIAETATKREKYKSVVRDQFEELKDSSYQSPNAESSTQTSSQLEGALFQSGTDTTALKSLKELEKLLAETNDKVISDKNNCENFKHKMLSKIRPADGQHQDKVLSRKHRRHVRHYTQQMPDATADEYQVHKWRLKSGRNESSNKFYERTLIQLQRKIKTMKERQISSSDPPMPSNIPLRKIKPRYLLRADKISTLDGKEQLFGLGDCRDAEAKSDKRRSNLLPRLRNRFIFRESLPLLRERPEVEVIQRQSDPYFESQSTGLIPDLFINNIPQNESSTKTYVSRRASESFAPRLRVLPPIAPVRRRQSLPMRRRLASNEVKSDQSLQFRRKSLIPSSSPIAIPENEMFRPSAKRTFQRNSEIGSLSGKQKKFDFEEFQTDGCNEYPIAKKSHSSMTTHSIGSVRSNSKEGKNGDTPDTEGSFGGAKRRLSIINRGSRLTKMDSRNSPQAFRYTRSSRIVTLMRQWYIYSKLTIWLSRLYKSHRISIDDSYKILHNSNDSVEGSDSHIKKEVLFDVTDYKMKNQLRLSDTTRKVLLTPSEKRTDKDVNLVQTALRNIKAVSNYSNSVQQKIGKLGYFVGFKGRRIVIKENKKPLNFYLLLAGSAVVIKSDEKGNTNPVLFLKRGDIFGEKEILDDTRWQWSVATSGYCEFLLLDRQDYKNIFITGGGGGLLSDPDREKFLRSIQLLQKWPISLLGENPNRCLFRHFKRGVVLAKDNNNSEWIYVIKSGSCSVLKSLQVEPLTESEILYRMKQEQKFQPEFAADPRLVDETDPIKKEDHFQLILKREKEEKNKEVSVYQQLEMSSILKELNPDVIGTIISPRAEVEFEDRRTEVPPPSYNAEAVNGKKTLKENKIEAENKPFGEEKENDFLSCYSGRQLPRTPSPTKAAYLQTGIRTRSGKRVGDPEEHGTFKPDVPPEIIPTENQNHNNSHKNMVSPQKQVHINEYLFSSFSPDQAHDELNTKKTLLPVHINVRRLTKRDMFGIEPHLYSNQPSLALVSNGTECLMLNKKFYLENANEDCIKSLREECYPYPSDKELEKEYLRLMIWKAFQARTLKEALNQKA